MFLGRVFGDKSCFCSMKSLVGRAFAGEVNTYIHTHFHFYRLLAGNPAMPGEVLASLISWISKLSPCGQIEARFAGRSALRAKL